MTKKTDKQKAFIEAMADINKKWQKNLGTKDSVIDLLPAMSADVETFSSGSVIVDNILGGGFAKGRVVEIYGAEGSGKTSIALTAVGNVQREGGNCVFMDVEQAFDPNYATKLGVNLDELMFTQPSVAEDVLNMAREIILTGEVDLIVIDSVAAMMPRAQYDEDIGKANIALLARMLSQSLPIFTKICNENDCTLIFINQVRDNVGVMYGPKTATPGGKALKFYASQRLEIRKVGKVEETIDKKKEIVGNEVKVKCVKNKIAPPYGEGSTVLTFNKGINKSAELFIVGLELGIINQVGQRFYIEDTDELDKDKYERDENGLKIATYQSATREAIENDPKLEKIIGDKVVKTLNEMRDKGTFTEEMTEGSNEN